jgi:hypothetical protein
MLDKKELTMPTRPDVPADVVAALAALSDPKPLRRGSFGERLIKCGKRTCPCQNDPAARHGPYAEVQRIVRGKRVARLLKPEQVDAAKAHVVAAREFRERVEDLWAAAERWADAELDALGAPARETPKKGGSKRRS